MNPHEHHLQSLGTSGPARPLGRRFFRISALIVSALAALMAAAAPGQARTGYFQEGRYYASPAGAVAWMRVTDTALLVSDKRRAVASIARSDGAVRWSHHPSGGRIDALWLTSDGRSLVVAGVDLEVLDARTGAMRWAQRLGCKRPCENRVQSVTGDSVWVTGSGVTHQWLWRYGLKDGLPKWPKPLAIAHPRAFIVDETQAAKRAWLLEANAPFGIRELQLDSKRTQQRLLWSGARSKAALAGQRVSSVEDGRVLLTGPLPGGGLPPLAIARPGSPLLVPLQPVLPTALVGARITRTLAGAQVLAALGRRSTGEHALAVWALNRPTTAVLSLTSKHPLAVALTTDSNRGRTESLVAARRITEGTPAVELVGLDAVTGRRRMSARLTTQGRPRLLDVGEGQQPPSFAAVMVPLRSASAALASAGPLALFDSVSGRLLGVGAVERAARITQVQRTPTGLYVGAGRGVYSLLRVPLERAFKELGEEDANSLALMESLQWVPEAAPRLASLASRNARAGARNLRRLPPQKRLAALTGALARAQSRPVGKLMATMRPLLGAVAGLLANGGAGAFSDEWRALATVVQSVSQREDVDSAQRPVLRALVVLTALGLHQAGDSTEAMWLMDAWLARPGLSAPGEEALRQALALSALDRLYAGQAAQLVGSDDAKRQAAARLLAAFGGAKHALGDSQWLSERAQPVLTPSRPESIGAARALAKELSGVIEKATMRGRLGLSGPGCALACHVLETACNADCFGRACAKRRGRCLKRCKRKRTVAVKARQDACPTR